MKLPEITVSLPYCYLQKEREERSMMTGEGGFCGSRHGKLHQMDYINTAYQTLLEEVTFLYLSVKVNVRASVVISLSCFYFKYLININLFNNWMIRIFMSC